MCDLAELRQSYGHLIDSSFFSPHERGLLNNLLPGEMIEADFNTVYSLRRKLALAQTQRPSLPSCNIYTIDRWGQYFLSPPLEQGPYHRVPQMLDTLEKDDLWTLNPPDDAIPEMVEAVCEEGNVIGNTIIPHLTWGQRGMLIFLATPVGQVVGREAARCFFGLEENNTYITMINRLRGRLSTAINGSRLRIPNKEGYGYYLAMI